MPWAWSSFTALFSSREVAEATAPKVSAGLLRFFEEKRAPTRPPPLPPPLVPPFSTSLAISTPPNRDMGAKKEMWEYPQTFVMWSRGLGRRLFFFLSSLLFERGREKKE